MKMRNHSCVSICINSDHSFEIVPLFQFNQLENNCHHQQCSPIDDRHHSSFTHGNSPSETKNEHICQPNCAQKQQFFPHELLTVRLNCTSRYKIYDLDTINAQSCYSSVCERLYVGGCTSCSTIVFSL